MEVKKKKNEISFEELPHKAHASINCIFWEVPTVNVKGI